MPSKPDRVAKIIAAPQFGLDTKTVDQALGELDDAMVAALGLCETDFDRTELRKRFLERRLFILVARSKDLSEIVGGLRALVAEDTFDADRLRHIIEVALIELECRLKHGLGG